MRAVVMGSSYGKSSTHPVASNQWHHCARYLGLCQPLLEAAAESFEAAGAEDEVLGRPARLHARAGPAPPLLKAPAPCGDGQVLEEPKLNRRTLRLQAAWRRGFWQSRVSV